MSRFARTERLLGAEAVARLGAARVAVAGLGAVGSYAVEALARAGVGRLRLADFDVVRPSNLNRQLYALESTLGRPKVEVAAARVRDIHLDCAVEPLRLFVDRHSAAELLAGSPDLLLDAIDSVGPKVELLAAAARAGVPVVSSMGAATRLDPLAVRVGDLFETEVCPLARLIRKRLRRRGVEGVLRCVYSIEPAATAPPADGEAEEEAPAAARGRPRQALGSVSYLTGIFGLTAAAEAVRLLLARGSAE